MDDQPTIPDAQSYEPPAYVREARTAKPSWVLSTNQRILYSVIASIVIIVCCAGGIAAAANGQQSSAGDSTTGGQLITSAAPTDTPTPKPTTNPNSATLVIAYTTKVESDSSTVGADLNLVGTDCGDTSQLSLCRRDLVTLQADTRQFQTDLNETPAPPCLAQTDQMLRKALPLLDSGSQDVIDGIDTTDASKVSDGSALFRQATFDIQQATSAAKSANCA